MPTAAVDAPVQFKYRATKKPLSDFVLLLWYWHGYEVSYAKERIMPMGTVELIINLASGRTTDSGIAGPRSESLIIERSASDDMLGVHFKPGGAFPFLAFPFGDLHNGDATLADLWGERRASELLCLLHDAATIDAKFELIENWLMEFANRPLDHHPAVSFALREFQTDSALQSSALMADKVGYSQRRFIQLFRDEVGMTPKLFGRVRRFSEIIQMIQTRNSVDWTDLALSFGYTDQSHFIHDFHEFSGVTPTEYLGLRTSHPGHLQFPE